MLNGTVKWFSNEKGYGFVIAEDGKEYFAHFTKIVMDGFKTLSQGQKVTFDIVEGEKGPQADAITPVQTGE